MTDDQQPDLKAFAKEKEKQEAAARNGARQIVAQAARVGQQQYVGLKAIEGRDDIAQELSYTHSLLRAFSIDTDNPAELSAFQVGFMYAVGLGSPTIMRLAGRRAHELRVDPVASAAMPPMRTTDDE